MHPLPSTDPNTSRPRLLLHLASQHQWDEVDARVLAGEDPCVPVPLDINSPFCKSVIDLFFHDPAGGVVERLQRWLDAGVDLGRAVPETSRPGGTLRLMMEYGGQTDPDLAKLLAFVMDRGVAWTDAQEQATLLRTCVTFNRPRCLDVLLAHGIDLHGARFTALDNYQPPSVPGRAFNQAPDQDRTLLHLAASERHAGMVKRLLELGMDPTAASAQGMIPLNTCFLNRWDDTAQTMRHLLTAGAPRDRSAVGANGFTVDELAFHLRGTPSQELWATALRLHEQDQLRAVVGDRPDIAVTPRARSRL